MAADGRGSGKHSRKRKAPSVNAEPVNRPSGRRDGKDVYGTHVPTDETRRAVSVLASAGVHHDVIARSIGITSPTMRKWYRVELDQGLDIANATVISTMFNLAVSGECPSATIFWLKARAGWRERTVVENVGADGQPIKSELAIRVEYADVDTNTSAVASASADNQE